MIIATCSSNYITVYNIHQNSTSSKPFLDHTQMGVRYLALDYDFEYDLVVGCSSDQKIRIFNEKGS